MKKKHKERKETGEARTRKADTQARKHPVIMNRQERIRLFIASIVASAKGAIKIAKDQNFKEDIVIGLSLQNFIDFPYYELEFDVQFLKELLPIHDNEELEYLLEQHLGSGLNIYGFINGERFDVMKTMATKEDSTNKQ